MRAGLGAAVHADNVMVRHHVNLLALEELVSAGFVVEGLVDVAFEVELQVRNITSRGVGSRGYCLYGCTLWYFDLLDVCVAGASIKHLRLEAILKDQLDSGQTASCHALSPDGDESLRRRCPAIEGVLVLNRILIAEAIRHIDLA